MANIPRKENPDMPLSLCLALYLSLLLLINAAVDSKPITSCAQTPYPATCESYMGKTVLSSLEEDSNAMVAFHRAALRVAMDQAVEVRRLVATMDVSSFGGRARSAWSDCLELYDDAVYHLNRSMGLRTVGSADSQTWLSAAVTSDVTCRDGLKEMSLESQLLRYFPNVVMTSFSELLSNSLAVNRANAAATPSGRGRRRLMSTVTGGGFPSWVSYSDRKLLVSDAAADIVVAKDGSGDFETISEAVAAASSRRSGDRRFVIHVKAGTYDEHVEITRSMRNLMIVGDGMDATVVVGSRNAGSGGQQTFGTATFAVTGDGFFARGMTFVNTAGPQNHQAVALRSGSDLSVFYSCSFKGYQDTLYVYTQRQFYRDCDVYGTVDFIFGNAVAVLQNCNIYPRKPMSGQMNTLTAQGRTDPNQNTGIVLHGCRITATSDLRSAGGSVKTYLGRPWQKYSRTVVMKSTIDSVIDPKGWAPWSGSFALSTLYYGEYLNSGAGAGTGGRVQWPGYHPDMSASDAGKFTVGDFLAGDSWIPGTGVPFSAGL
ncbi:hypothetical protein SAY87_001942 [Trapa incisa]|uniref:Pectinesterase n=1 Tax=Trapa incisa TaxID=236973 RepID=A0AAN7JTC1_9MYRT|nr:hypothetical protein SAY87_001942 [Trapa incisa]